MAQYSCPASAAIPSITSATCLENFGQTQKLAFQRVFASAGVKNAFTATGLGDIKLKASWDTFLAAADATKAQMSPVVEQPAITAGAARTKGGGNATVGGINKVIGSEATTATFLINVSKQAIIAQLKDFQDELSLGVFMFNEYGQIGCLVDDPATPAAYYPIPIASQTLFVGDKSIMGLEDEDNNVLSWNFYPNWSDKFVVVTPTDFNPLTDLVNP